MCQTCKKMEKSLLVDKNIKTTTPTKKIYPPVWYLFIHNPWDMFLINTISICILIELLRVKNCIPVLYAVEGLFVRDVVH